jgi:hypothetical protein
MPCGVVPGLHSPCRKGQVEAFSVVIGSLAASGRACRLPESSFHVSRGGADCYRRSNAVAGCGWSNAKAHGDTATYGDSSGEYTYVGDRIQTVSDAGGRRRALSDPDSRLEDPPGQGDRLGQGGSRCRGGTGRVQRLPVTVLCRVGDPAQSSVRRVSDGAVGGVPALSARLDP